MSFFQNLSAPLKLLEDTVSLRQPISPKCSLDLYGQIPASRQAPPTGCRLLNRNRTASEQAPPSWMFRQVGPTPFQGHPVFLSLPASHLRAPCLLPQSTLSPITPIWLHHLYLPQNLVCNGLHVVESERHISVLLLSFSDAINPAGHTHLLVRFWALGLLHTTSSRFSLSWPHFVVSSAGSACSPGLLNTRIPRGPGKAPHFSALSP